MKHPEEAISDMEIEPIIPDSFWTLNIESEKKSEDHHTSPSSIESTIIDKIHGVKVYVHASQMSKVMAGNIGITGKQNTKFRTLLLRGLRSVSGRTYLNGKEAKALTPNMIKELNDLNDKRNNADISNGAKSHLDELITTSWYGVSPRTTSKHTAHGDHYEPISIQDINTNLGTNFVKCEERKTDDELMISGIVDSYSKEYDCVIDIKNPYDVVTFDKKRKFNIVPHDNPNPKLDSLQKMYWWQMQCYMHLYDVSCAYLFYTLYENYSMSANEINYSALGFKDRVIVKRVDRNRNAIKLYKERRPYIERAIENQKIDRVLSMVETEEHLNYFLNYKKAN